MKHFTFAVSAALLLAACGGAAAPSPTPSPPSPTRPPTPTPTAASQIIFTADLKASNEVPPITNAEKDATGMVTITFDLTRDSSGKITAATSKFDFSVKDLPAAAKLNLAHIHQAAAGANGDIKVNTGLTADTGLTPTGGATTSSKSGIAVAGELAQQIVDNPAGFYFNVHSTLNPGGVVRGQLTKRS